LFATVVSTPSAACNFGLTYFHDGGESEVPQLESNEIDMPALEQRNMPRCEPVLMIRMLF